MVEELSYPSLRAHVSHPLQATKWLKYPVLIDAEEMQGLIAHLGKFRMFHVSGPVASGKGEIAASDFLKCYTEYVETLKQGKMPSLEGNVRALFSCVWTLSTDILYAVSVPGEKEVIKVERPVIQLQPHKFDYSASEEKFRSMVFGLDSILWGIQFSYPQLYQDDEMQIKKVVDNEEFPNTKMFKLLQQWVRHETMATPFIVDGKQFNVPIRIGKKCLPWINNHPQLEARSIQVKY